MMTILGNELSDPVLYVKLTVIMLFFLTFVLLKLKDKFSETQKKFFFYLIVITVMGSTLYLAGNTVYKNLTSETGGPVHWHLDYQVWACGERLNLVDPKGFRNKIGSPLFHEHDDDRIHVEGTVKKLSDVDLQSYFEIINGKLTKDSITYPVEGKGDLTFTNGDLCNGQEATLKVFLNGKRVDQFENYVMYPHALVPPGDCVIFEFSEGNSQTTDKICNSWAANEWNYNNYETLRGDNN